MMHTSRWDDSVDLAGKRVAVIGTGASAVQVVPELAKTAAAVTVFQRTPPWMVPKDDRPFTADELARFRRLPWAARRERWRLWKEQHDNTALRADDPLVAQRQAIGERFLQRQVADERLRAALTPDLPVPVQTGAARRGLLHRIAIRQRRPGDRTDPGRSRDVESVPSRSMPSCWPPDSRPATTCPASTCSAPMRQSLHARWAEDPTAYLGVAVSGFPELLHAVRAQHQPGRQLDRLRPGGRRPAGGRRRAVGSHGAAAALEVRPGAERRYNEEISAELERTVWTQCGSYFRSPSGRIVTQWPYTEIEYARRTWRLRARRLAPRTGVLTSRAAGSRSRESASRSAS